MPDAVVSKSVGKATASLITGSLVAVAIVGCGQRPSDEARRAGDFPSSGVGIEAMGCSLRPSIGSGAIVARDGFVMTVAHTVAGANEVVVIDDDGVRHGAELRFLDPASDIAIIEVEGLEGEPLPLGSASPPVEGQLLVWDHDQGIGTKPVVVERRLRVTIEDIYIEADVQRTAFELSGSIIDGDSGAMVVVDDSVVGMVYARSRADDARGFAIDEQELNDAFDALDALGSRGEPIDSGACVP